LNHFILIQRKETRFGGFFTNFVSQSVMDSLKKRVIRQPTAWPGLGRALCVLVLYWYGLPQLGHLRLTQLTDLAPDSTMLSRFFW
jgi:hypothetical protein